MSSRRKPKVQRYWRGRAPDQAPSSDNAKSNEHPVAPARTLPSVVPRREEPTKQDSSASDSSSSDASSSSVADIPRRRPVAEPTIVSAAGTTIASSSRAPRSPSVHTSPEPSGAARGQSVPRGPTSPPSRSSSASSSSSSSPSSPGPPSRGRRQSPSSSASSESSSAADNRRARALAKRRAASSSAVPPAKSNDVTATPDRKKQGNGHSSTSSSGRGSGASRSSHSSRSRSSSSGSTGSSTDSSDEEDDENELAAAAMAAAARPQFVSKAARASGGIRGVVASTSGVAGQDEATREKVAQRKREEALALLQDQLEKDRLGGVGIDGADAAGAADEELRQLDDRDDNLTPEEEAAEFAAWRVRELARIKRELEAQYKHEGESDELARRRQMTDAEIARVDADILSKQKEPRKKLKFLQRYYHAGAFFRGGDEGDILEGRDFSAPTGEDLFDKSALPKVMQVKSGYWGKKGRTKYTHLADQDTTDRSSQWFADADLRRTHQQKMGGMGSVVDAKKAKRPSAQSSSGSDSKRRKKD